MDEHGPLTGAQSAQAALPALPPDGRYSGEDGSGHVRVEIDSAARHVVVALWGGWRGALAGNKLAAAVLQAVFGATTARLTAWAAGPVAQVPPPTRAGRAAVSSTSQAWQELREFRQRLSTLLAATGSVSSPGRKVVVTVADGGLVGVEIDPAWQRIATSRDLEHHVAHALRGAFALIAGLPERALDGYPALRALLSDTPLTPGSEEETR
ncbi:hypothetical protein [Pseudonocardia sp. MH-G8]|uniref:hypothetical protein n=1 Tax=Pseudonocardia sp. MH-G8 TaxID=1854588 RepID=UPI000BA0FC29|nr:hypothetical protein [Pseudonocardia sp. MH-G8]OZM76981.1 hypothetical protein CFP66_38145 [Pseudonocardia sp. MH-G8]